MSDPKWAVVDLETSVNNKIGKNKASPHSPLNKIVAVGVRGPEFGAYNYVADSPSVVYGTIPSSVEMIVGHNVGFDAQYLRGEGDYAYADRFRKIRLADTGLAAYLLSAQEHRWPSLDELSVKYGLPVKDDRLKTMWESGIKTEDIAPSILMPYLEQDCENTYTIFRKQVEELKAANMLPLYRVQCTALQALVEMQFNGMCVHKDRLAGKIKVYTARLNDEVVKIGTHFPGVEWTSNKELSLYFFGGKRKEKEYREVGTYKNGKTKTKAFDKIVEVPSKISPEVVGAELGASGYYSVDETVLSNIVKWTPPTALAYGDDFRMLASHVLAYRAVDKQLNTYLAPIDSLLMPSGYIHADLNNTATITGRLSSSNPNLQNITAGDDSPVKQVFTSRWGIGGGVIIEADFKQLEMVALAYLSQDKQLIEDINNGIDIHRELYMSLFHREPSKEERRQFKRASFALVYGAGPGKIAETVGLSITTVRDFIKAFKKRYPDVVNWWDTVADKVKGNREYVGDKDANGLPVGRSYYTLPTGRKLLFKEYADKYGVGAMGGSTSFSPSEMKNYPVQSFATADIVPMVLGKLFKELMNNELLKDTCVLVNTVHDSVLLDCRIDVIEDALKLIIPVLTNVKQHLSDEFNIDNFNVDLTVEVAYGESWGKLDNEVNVKDYVNG